MLYNNRTWSTQSGSGSVAINSSCIGGIMRVRANASNYYEVYQSSLQFSLAKKFQLTIRGQVPDLTLSRAAFGIQTNVSNRIEWVYEAALGANWRARSVLANVETIVDVGVAADSAWHEFKIIGITGLANFFLDGVPLATITTNLATGNLAPHIRATSTNATTRDALVDWVETWGARA
jgi:hypothetical protein